jgi:hypothetical protein
MDTSSIDRQFRGVIDCVNDEKGREKERTEGGGECMIRVELVKHVCLGSDPLLFPSLAERLAELARMSASASDEADANNFVACIDYELVLPHHHTLNMSVSKCTCDNVEATEEKVALFQKGKF